MTMATVTTAQQNQLYDWLNEKNNRGARAARFLVHCFDVVCQTLT